MGVSQWELGRQVAQADSAAIVKDTLKLFGCNMLKAAAERRQSLDDDLVANALEDVADAITETVNASKK
jgi:hypothetical protein